MKIIKMARILRSNYELELDIKARLERSRKSPFAEDAKALASDWQQVGNDLWGAIRKVAEDYKKKP